MITSCHVISSYHYTIVIFMTMSSCHHVMSCFVIIPWLCHHPIYDHESEKSPRSPTRSIFLDWRSFAGNTSRTWTKKWISGLLCTPQKSIFNFFLRFFVVEIFICFNNNLAASLKVTHFFHQGRAQQTTEAGKLKKDTNLQIVKDF